MTLLLGERWKALTVDQEEAERIGLVLENLERQFQTAASGLDHLAGFALIFRASIDETIR